MALQFDHIFFTGQKNKDFFKQLYPDLQVVEKNPGLPAAQSFTLLVVDCDSAFDYSLLTKSPYFGVLVVAAAGDEPKMIDAENVEFVREPLQNWQVEKRIRNLRRILENVHHATELQTQIATTEQNLSELLRIGIALSVERDPEKLLELILTQARQITSADAGSLYLVEKNGSQRDSEKHLRFTLAQNESIKANYKASVIPIEKNSMAGYTAFTGLPVNIPDAYKLAVDSPFRHDKSFDDKHGYRTHSVLCIPMKSHEGEPIGVLQLINRKRTAHTKLLPATFEKEVIPFDAECVQLASSLASQAAVSIENMRLYEEIRNLFESFIIASVHAIEQRDPTTSGHSERVAKLTVDLAKSIDRLNDGELKNVYFTRNDLQQLKYASLLHDFGKIGVREHVLVKAKKLYPDQLERIHQRFKYIKKSIECDFMQRKVRLVGQQDCGEQMAHIQEEADKKLAWIDECMNIILEANEPNLLPEEYRNKLSHLCKNSHYFDDGKQPLLTSDEIAMLSIPHGSLTEDERKEIESHVTHSFNFLIKIPWASHLKNVPDLAYMHHEKLDGSGYPRGLEAAEIPLPVRIMTITDIFDSLTARDRPYKKAVSVQYALDILRKEAKAGKVDPHILEIFIESQIYKSVF